MLRALGVLGPVLLVTIVTIAGVLFFYPDLSDNDVDRLSAVSTLLLSAALVLVTAKYSNETTKIAQASEQQTEAILKQLELDTIPKLLLFITRPMPGSNTTNLLAVNLSRHQLWITKVQSGVEAYGSPEVNLALKGGMALTPEKPAIIGMYLPRHERGTVQVDFYYGPTGGMLHSKQWYLELSGEDATVTEA